jgi:transposase InsO family protein
MNAHSLARTTPISRAVLIGRVLDEGRSVVQTAAALGISTRTVYKWLARYRSEGAAGLRDRPSRPRRSPARVSAEREELILRLRRSRQTGPQIARGLRMPTATVARVLKRAGLHRLRLLEPPERPHRYERKQPGELLHLDVKKLARIAGHVGHRIHGDRTKRIYGAGWEFAHVAIDDASRLAYVEVLSDEKGHTTVGFLQRALAWYRAHGIRVQRILSDNGTNYRSHVFLRFCLHRSIRVLKTRPYRPQTNGKAERFIQTLIREWAYARPFTHSRFRTRALPPWLRYYNQRRPHGSLDGKPPISRLRGIREQRL